MGVPDDPKRVVTYRFNGKDEQRVIILSEKYPSESDIPEILAKDHGTTEDKIEAIRIMD